MHRLLGCKVSGGRAAIVGAVSCTSGTVFGHSSRPALPDVSLCGTSGSTLGPIALRPVISGGLLIIISGWATIAPAGCRQSESTYTLCKLVRGTPPDPMPSADRRGFRPLALRPAVSNGLPFIISGQADIVVQKIEHISSQLSENTLVPLALRPKVSFGLPKKWVLLRFAIVTRIAVLLSSRCSRYPWQQKRCVRRILSRWTFICHAIPPFLT